MSTHGDRHVCETEYRSATLDNSLDHYPAGNRHPSCLSSQRGARGFHRKAHYAGYLVCCQYVGHDVEQLATIVRRDIVIDRWRNR